MVTLSAIWSAIELVTWSVIASEIASATATAIWSVIVTGNESANEKVNASEAERKWEPECLKSEASSEIS